MDESGHKPIRAQIFRVNLILIAATLVLAMGTTLYLTLSQNRQAMNDNLLNSARLIAQEPTVRAALEAGQPNVELWEFLDVATARISDIDVIVLADVNGIQYYYPDRAYVGQPYAGTDQKRIFQGEAYYISDDTGLSGAERCAYAEVRGEDGQLLGFVMVGIYVRSYTALVRHTVLQYAAILAVVAVLGGLFSAKLSARIRRPLMGYEPADFFALFHQREDILEALEEGVLAIDSGEKIIYLNSAAARMIGVDREKAVGTPLKEIYPTSNLGQVVKSGRSEYNLSLQGQGQMLAYHIPVREGKRTVGAVAILRNRTAVTRLAEDLTGVKHMVEAMRAYTHEFMNKLHIILGLLQIGEPEKAEEYIMNVTSIHQKAIGLITERIQDPSAAALLVGKTSRCAELGIRMSLDPHSVLERNAGVLPPDVYVTVLGNLIENAVDGLNRTTLGLKEITVSIRERQGELLISVEDTGPGMSPDLVKQIFQRNFSTKGKSRGTGLALVKETVDAYGGEIRVESEPGIGTTVFVRFPMPDGGMEEEGREE